MRDDAEEMPNRLKASDLLGKIQADFVARMEVSGPGRKAIEVRQITRLKEAMKILEEAGIDLASI